MEINTASGRNWLPSAELVMSAGRSAKAFHYRAIDTKFFPP